jgi:hypothetical protein
MPADQILSLLIAEGERLNRAIEALQGSAKVGRRTLNPQLGRMSPLFERGSATAGVRHKEKHKGG